MTVSSTARQLCFMLGMSGAPPKPIWPLTRLSFCCTLLCLLVGVSIVMERERQQNDSLVNG